MSLDINEQYDKIYRYCFLRVRHKETAEDLTQETFLRYLEHPQYHSEDKTLQLTGGFDLLVIVGIVYLPAFIPCLTLVPQKCVDFIGCHAANIFCPGSVVATQNITVDICADFSVDRRLI